MKRFWFKSNRSFPSVVLVALISLLLWGVFSFTNPSFLSLGDNLKIKAENLKEFEEEDISRKNFVVPEEEVVFEQEEKGREQGDSMPKRGGSGYKDYVEGEVLVKFKEGKIDLKTSSGRYLAQNFISKMAVEKTEDLSIGNISVLKIRDNKTVEEKILELEKDPNVEYAEPNYIYYSFSINTNDTHRNLLWGLHNTGQTVNGVSGKSDADIDAPEAWAINEGTNSTVIVAVIDDGVAYNHPDLKANMWNGSNCKDHNGSYLGGCNHGYDYVDNDKTPLPADNHGTHVAGTISAVKNNNRGIVGVAPRAKIMALRIGFGLGFDTASIVKSIDFAIQNEARIINASFGGTSYSQVMYDAINRFRSSGGIFVASAGNTGANSNTNPNYPASYNLNNIISVAATDQNDNLASFSNYGSATVHVGAPGVNIYSTVPNSIESLSEDFQSLTPPAVPSGWVKGGINNNWGTYDFGSIKVLYGDLSYPYASNANTTITSPTYNLSSSGATFSFWTKCETEIAYFNWYDYMALEFSSNGGASFTEILKWDEVEIRSWEPVDDGSDIKTLSLTIPSSYLTSNFKFRLRWVTDSTLNNYDGCFVTNIKITKNDDGSNGQYKFTNGTSMAAPHVSGVVALIWGTRPFLSMSDVRNTVINSGDALISLGGKTISGKRVNAKKALEDASQPRNVFQVHVGLNNRIYTRLSNDGVVWSGWRQGSDSNEFTNHPVTMANFKNKLYQVHVGGTGRIFTRDSLDGLTWSGWRSSGDSNEFTEHPVTISVFNNKLYQVHVGGNGQIFTRYSSDGLSWSGWRRGDDPNEFTKHAVYMAEFNSKLYQVHVGGSGQIFTRYSSDGLTWSGWRRGEDLNEFTDFPVDMLTFNNRLYQVHVGGSGQIFTRYSTDGSTWSGWRRGDDPNEFTGYTVNMAVFKDKLYQVHVGGLGQIFTRNSSDGSTWSGWRRGSDPNEATKNPVSMEAF